MTSREREERLRAFLKTVAECTEDRGHLMTQPAQEFIKTFLNERIPESRPGEFIAFAESVARHFGGLRPELAKSYNEILLSIPCEDTTGKRARHAIDKVGLELGLRPPHDRCF